MSIPNNVLEAVRKLVALTQDRKMTWQPLDVSSAFQRPSSSVEGYSGFYQGAEFIVYCYKPDGAENYYGNEFIGLELVSTNGTKNWKFPTTESDRELLEAIRIRIGNIDERLRNFLKG